MNSEKDLRIIDILLVEDNLGDIRLTQEVLKDGKIKNKLSVVTDGEEAIFFLKKIGKYKDATTPDLILLDLNLPKKDGREVLTEIKKDPNFSSIPVVILTTSDDEKDIVSSYAGQANAFITKPVDFNQFVTVIRAIEDFWLTIVKLPKK
ncbi:MAG: response regulator [Bacteroidota bacterium]